MKSSKPKLNYLDTSVIISLLLYPKDYTDYLRNTIGSDKLYITAYNWMEFNNAIIARCLAIYSAVLMPSYETTNDAFVYFSQRFNHRDNIMLICLFGQILKRRQIDLHRSADKEIAAFEIWRVIKDIDRRFKKTFTDCGYNRTQCVRAKCELNFDAPIAREEAEKFVKQFSGTNHRSQCNVDDFILKVCRDEASGFVVKAETVTGSGDTNFRKLTKRVQKALDDLPKKTCDQCAKMGDAVIALQAPREMRLVHTDNSFNFLCEVTGQEHLKLDYPGTFDKKRNTVPDP